MLTYILIIHDFSALVWFIHKVRILYKSYGLSRSNSELTTATNNILFSYSPFLLGLAFPPPFSLHRAHSISGSFRSGSLAVNFNLVPADWLWKRATFCHFRYCDHANLFALAGKHFMICGQHFWVFCWGRWGYYRYY